MKYNRTSIRRMHVKRYKKSKCIKDSLNKSNAIAYCHYKEHKGYLSKALLKQHQCVQKNCKYLQKYEHKRYWVEKKIVSVVKKYNRDRQVGYIAIGNELYKTNNVDKLYSEYLKIAVNTGNNPSIKYMKAHNDE